MFCDEKIVRVYLQKFKYDYPGADFFFNYFDEIVFYTTDEYKIVLETENRMLALGISGIFNYSKTDYILSDCEFLESDIIELPGDDERYIGFQTELFIGERLLNVEKKNDIFFLTFDDFTMKVMHFHNKISNTRSEYDICFTLNRVAGCDRYIKRKCYCSGNGEILYKGISGYVVRCKNCYKSTDWFNCISDATDCWNAGKVTYKIDSTRIE